MRSVIAQTPFPRRDFDDAVAHFASAARQGHHLQRAFALAFDAAGVDDREPPIETADVLDRHPDLCGRNLQLLLMTTAAVISAAPVLQVA